MKNGKNVAQLDLENSEEFNGHFTDVLKKNEHTQVPLLDRSAPFMNDIVISKDGVIKLLKGLNPSKALGPDELHPRVLKELATELGPVFAHLFQQSMDTGEIPKEWSLANKYKEDTMKLQRDIDQLGSWARKWGMRFQPVKCNMMQLTRKRSIRSMLHIP